MGILTQDLALPQNTERALLTGDARKEYLKKRAYLLKPLVDPNSDSNFPELANHELKNLYAATWKAIIPAEIYESVKSVPKRSILGQNAF